MLDNQPKCLECKGGCCINDARLYGFLKIDLINLASKNLVQNFQPGAFKDINLMYSQLKKDNAPNGYYTIKNDIYGLDIDGVRIGPCNDCIDGLCDLQDIKPHPCKMMDYEGPVCLKILSQRLAELSTNNSNLKTP